MRHFLLIGLSVALLACGGASTDDATGTALPAVQPDGPQLTAPPTTIPEALTSTTISPDNGPTTVDPEDPGGSADPADPEDPELVGVLSPEVCVVTDRTLRTAMEAHYAQHREEAASIEELVDDGLLRESTPHFEVVPPTETEIATIQPVAGGACDYDYDAEYGSTAGVRSAEAASAECAVSVAILRTAADRLATVDGTRPTSVDSVTERWPELAGMITSVGLDEDGDVVTDADRCDPRDVMRDAGPDWADVSESCATDVAQLSVAIRIAELDGVDLPTFGDLVDGGFVPDRSYGYTVATMTDPTGAPAAIVADAQGSGCPPVDALTGR